VIPIEFLYDQTPRPDALCQGAKCCPKPPIIIARIEGWERPVCLDHFMVLLRRKYPEARQSGLDRPDEMG
jgi:hypothetical protein